jgi:hypothetical protein
MEGWKDFVAKGEAAAQKWGVDRFLKKEIAHTEKELEVEIGKDFAERISTAMLVWVSGRNSEYPVLILEAKSDQTALDLEKLLTKLFKETESGLTLMRQGRYLGTASEAKLVEASLLHGQAKNGFAQNPSVKSVLEKTDRLHLLGLTRLGPALSHELESQLKEVVGKLGDDAGRQSVYRKWLVKQRPVVKQLVQSLPAGEFSLGLHDDRIILRLRQTGLEKLSTPLINLLVEWELRNHYAQ